MRLERALDRAVLAVGDAADAARNAGPTGLAAFRRLAQQVAVEEQLVVENLRFRGFTWQEMADELGQTRQAVQKRYGGGTAESKPSG